MTVITRLQRNLLVLGTFAGFLQLCLAQASDTEPTDPTGGRQTKRKGTGTIDTGNSNGTEIKNTKSDGNTTMMGDEGDSNDGAAPTTISNLPTSGGTEEDNPISSGCEHTAGIAHLEGFWALLWKIVSLCALTAAV